MRSLRAAAGSVRLPTPAAGPLAGYAARNGNANGTSDPLEANLLLIDDGAGGRLLWISIDVVAIVDDLRTAIVTAITRLTELLAEQIICVASHTHSAPAGWVGTIHPVLPADLDHAAIDAVATAIAGGAVELRPETSELRWAEGVVTGVGGNRRDPAGPTDQSVGVLQIDSVTGPVAIVYDYACHPTVLGPNHRQCSADWVGAARARLRQQCGAGLPVLFLQGCAGDQSTRFLRRDQSVDEVRRMGELVGDAVLAALPGAPLEHEGLAIEHAQLQLVTRQQAVAAGIPAELELPLTLVRIGERRWLHCSVELYSAAGQRLRAAASGLRVIGYTDGYHSYLAAPEAFQDHQYEAQSSHFDLQRTEQFVTYCEELVQAHADR